MNRVNTNQEAEWLLTLLVLGKFQVLAVLVAGISHSPTGITHSQSLVSFSTNCRLYRGHASGHLETTSRMWIGLNQLRTQTSGGLW